MKDRPIYLNLVLVFFFVFGALGVIPQSVHADNTPQSLPFALGWSDTGLITVNDDWSGVPGIVGYLGDGVTSTNDVDPQTLLDDYTSVVVDVIANQSSVGISNGGVAEFDGITNPVVAMQGSGTADAPFLMLSVDTTGYKDINVSYLVRDIDSGADNSVQQLALHYRVGSSGSFTNVPGAYLADASDGPSLTKDTPVSVVLPSDADDKSLVMLRIMTTNATGSDEWLGIDDVIISGSLVAEPKLVINEFDYDQDGTDAAEFIELKNVGISPIDLVGYSLELVNGSGGGASIYQTYALPAGVVGPGDYYVICANSAIVANCDLDVSPDTNLIQNGAPDAVALRYNADLVDAVSYEGDTVAPYTEGSGVGLEDGGDFSGSISRCPDGVDTDQNNIDFVNADLPTPGAENSCPIPTADPGINEFVVDNGESSDPYEYVEIIGDPDTDYSDYTILQIEGDSSGSGVIDTVLSVGTTDTNGIWWSGFYDDEFENGTITLLLVKNFTGLDGDDLDSDNDGIFETTPWDAIVDSVAVPDGDADDHTYGLPELPPNFDGNSYQPGGASRIPDGFDTETDTDWVRNGFYFIGLPDIGEAFNTPGEFNLVNGCGEDYTAIYDIQGSGVITPFGGVDVVTEGIVVGDFQTDGYVSGSKNGFYIQDMTGDGDPSTSDGVFVYYYDSDVQVGDYVRVVGEAYEYNDVTQLGYIDSLFVCDVGQPLPAPTVVSLPVTDKADLEMLEGMRVLFPQDFVVSEYFNFDRYGEIVLTTQRYSQYTAANEPDVAGYAAAVEEFNLNSITLDDGRTGQNPDPAIHPNGLEFDLYNRFRGGDLVTNLTGVMDYGFGLWRIQPTEGADYTPVNPRTTAPDILPGDIKVASFNVLNYFTTIDNDPSDTGDDPSDLCGPNGGMDCRGADTIEEFERQKTKIIEALAIIDADIVGLMEIENDRLSETPDYPVADLVAGLNDKMGAGTYDYIATGAIGTDAIKVALIYKPAKVTPVGDYAILDSTVDPRFLDDYNRPTLAQTFIDNLVGESITVAVNHLKSKGSSCDAISDPDVGDGQGNCNLTRLAAAQAEVDWLESDPTGTGVDKFLIIGDLNSYDKEDPIDAIKLGADDTPGTDDDFYDLAFEILGEHAYGYVFDGKTGYLDYAMVNKNLKEFVVDFTIWNINADEPDIIDYDMSFKQDAQDALWEPHAYRASDHDPVIITLTFNQPPMAKDDYYETDQDVTLVVSAPGLLENDIELNEYDTIMIDVRVEPEHGELILEQDGSFTYIPDPLFFGEDSFVYDMIATPPERGEFVDTATVYITVHPAYQYYMPVGFR